MFSKVLHFCSLLLKMSAKVLIKQVNLEEKKGVVSIDPGITSPEKVRDHIDDMGFEATLLQADSAMDVETCVVSIKGMTCNSCVKNIEGTVGGKPGVITIKVSLLITEKRLHVIHIFK